MNQTKTPPWERIFVLTSSLEKLIAHHWIIGGAHKAEEAWSELCALQAVAEAVREWVTAANAPSDAEMSDASDAWEKITDALRALEAICPR